MGIINSGEVSVLTQPPHPCRWPWNSSSAVAPSYDLPLNSAACPSEASQDTCSEYKPFFISSSVALFQQKRAEMGCVQGHERRLFFFFFFFGVCGVLFLFKGSGP